MTSERKIYFYPVWLRIWHGINAIGILILIATGISMLYSNPEVPLIDFELAVNLHNISGILVSINFLIFSLGNLFTPNKKYYRIKFKGLYKRLQMQAAYYAYGMFKGQQPPFPLSEKRKFNPLQKVSYLVTMYLFLPGIIITGFGLLFPETIIDNVYTLSGIFLTAILHTILGFFVSFFLIIHLYVASIGKNPMSNFKSIMDGYHYINH